MTLDLSRKEPMTSSEKPRRTAPKVRVKKSLGVGLGLRRRGKDIVFILGCLSKTPLTTAIIVDSPLPSVEYSE
ncbi:hypothetical protein V6N12_058621 [Hibiscus sabdariffa]|uniref:Uncharacterized protein n=1 Tax=Hibiscus sabdariffa TaxID=183260 RepID=A0ABR2ESN4_9ROSI